VTGRWWPLWVELLRPTPWATTRCEVYEADGWLVFAAEDGWRSDHRLEVRVSLGDLEDPDAVELLLRESVRAAER